MKKHLLLFIAITLAVTVIGQGNSQGKGKYKNKPGKEWKNEGRENEEGTWNVPQQTTEGKYSKNQPAKVRAAFQRDYPNAGNVEWTKYRGDWTATFNSGWGRSTAIYHANGERRDTRTIINRGQLPSGTVWDRIFKRDSVDPVGNIVQIQSPSLATEIFRIATQVAGSKLQYLFYNSTGQQVQYNY